MLIPAFTFNIGQQIHQGLVVVGKCKHYLTHLFKLQSTHETNFNMILQSMAEARLWPAGPLAEKYCFTRLTREALELTVAFRLLAY